MPDFLPMPTSTTAEQIAAVAKRFPLGSKVHRKDGVVTKEMTRYRNGVVSKVLAIGIHHDVFLKTDRMIGNLLDPAKYEVSE